MVEGKAPFREMLENILVLCDESEQKCRLFRLRLAFIVSPILGFFLLGGAS